MNILNLAGEVLFTSALTILRDVVIEAVSKKADLDAANLRGANLHAANLDGANLHGANLHGANLYAANLHAANLDGANLDGANLRAANLRGANLHAANLDGANLHAANLDGANLYAANLYAANLRGANLYGANLHAANLDGANLYAANLHGATLDGATLDGANLRGANLRAAKNAELTVARLQFIPEEGSFVGWKKCRDGVVVKLWIGRTAKRSHGSERKCRASRVKVAEVIGADIGISLHDANVTYRKGQIVEPLNGWGENRWDVCAPGIHFYLTKIEAENHQ